MDKHLWYEDMRRIEERNVSQTEFSVGARAANGRRRGNHEQENWNRATGCNEVVGRKFCCERQGTGER